MASIVNIETYAVSESWDEGNGRYTNLPTSSDGTSWIYRDNNIDQNKWETGSFAAATTGSVAGTLVTGGGGTWYTGSGFSSTQQFLKGEGLDLNSNVTDIIKKWSSSLFNNQTHPDGIDNNGFIIKQPNTIEENTTSSFGDLQYFSVDTHTIFPPKLTFKWDDSSNISNQQSLSTDLSDNLEVVLHQNQKEYNKNDIVSFRIHVRDKYPTRAFSTTSNYLNVGYFNITSSYSIRDAYTEQEIIPFDDTFTKLSSDSNGMYFKMYMNGLQPERYYRLLFKNKKQNGLTTVYDNKYYFKVVR